MKNICLIFLLILTVSCQREKVSEVGVGYNKDLIIPPSNDLPIPGNSDTDQFKVTEDNKNPLIKSILENTEADLVNSSIIDKIDDDSGYKSDEGFFDWLFNGGSIK